MKTIITSPSFDYMGEELSKELGIKKANVVMDRFPDSWPNIKIAKEDVQNKVATVLLDFSNPNDFFINYALLQGLIDYKVETLNIIMPYFPVGTMERIGKPGEVPTAHTFANILSNLPSGKSGRKNNLHILDIHAEVEEYLFDARNINVETHSAFELLKDEIEGKSIVFPDEGASKRFSNSFPDNEKIICSKKRIGDKRIIEIIEGDAKGKDVVIIDDLIQTGGTIIKTADLMRESGVNSVSSYATHGIFPNNTHIKLADSVDKLIISDSIPENNKRATNISNIEILGFKELVKNIILDC